MNTTIMAERQAKALDAIAAETARLGGSLDLAVGRVPNPQVKHTLMLEAIATALAGIGAPAGNVETEPVEAVISVVKEPAARPQPATPKGKRGKE